MTRGLALLGLCLLVLHAAAGARAQTDSGTRAALRVAPSADGCVSEASLTPRVRRWLDEAAQAQPSAIEVAVHGDSNPVSFSVLRDGRVIAERRFDVLPAACADRLDAIAVAIAVAIEHATSPAGASDAPDGGPAQPGAAERPGEPAPPDTAAPAPEPAAKTPEAADAAPEAPAPEDPEAGDDTEPPDEAAATTDTTGAGLRVFAGATLLLEVLPESAFALGAGAELQVAALRFAAGALYALPSETELAGGSASSQLLAARAHACLGTRLAGTDFDVEGCAGGAAGLVFASGEGFEANDDATIAWAAALLRAAVRYPASSPISLRFALDGLLNTVRPELEVSGQPPVRIAPGLVGAAGSLELVIALP